MHEVVYLKVLQCVIPPKIGQVSRLTKSLYGLKHVSCQWFEKSNTFLHAQDVVQAHANHTLFTKTTPTSFTTLLIYMDDIILAGKSLSEFSDMKLALAKIFHI